MPKVIKQFEYRGKPVSLAMDDPVIAAHVDEYSNFYEHWMLNFIERYIHRTGTWLDLGANFGNHSVYFSKFCMADKVVAFEPVTHNHRLLCENIKANGITNCDPIRGAVGRAHGMVDITKRKGDRWSQCKVTAGSAVQMYSIDEFNYQDVGLMKIDVEGCEVDAITGALDTISRCQPEIFVEIWQEETIREICEMLAPYGYTRQECYNPSPTYHFSIRNWPKIY